MNKSLLPALEGYVHDGVPDSESPGEPRQSVVGRAYYYNDNAMTSVPSAIPTHGNYHNYHRCVQ